MQNCNLTWRIYKSIITTDTCNTSFESFSKIVLTISQKTLVQDKNQGLKLPSTIFFHHPLGNFSSFLGDTGAKAFKGRKSKLVGTVWSGGQIGHGLKQARKQCRIIMGFFLLLHVRKSTISTILNHLNVLQEQQQQNQRQSNRDMTR